MRTLAFILAAALLSGAAFAFIHARETEGEWRERTSLCTWGERAAYESQRRVERHNLPFVLSDRCATDRATDPTVVLTAAVLAGFGAMALLAGVALGRRQD